MILVWVCITVSIAVYGLMAVCVWKYRPSSKSKRSFAMEMIWTAIPFALVVMLALPAILQQG